MGRRMQERSKGENVGGGQLTIKDTRGAIGKPATVEASLNICERNLNGIFK